MSSEVSPTRRTEPNKTARFAIAVGVLALLASVYTVIRIDVLRDRINTVRDSARQLEDSQSVLRAAQDKLDTDAASTRAKLAELSESQKELDALAASIDELRGRTDKPQRTWARAEALYLLQLADRQLQFTHDVRTAIAAVEAADARLAELRDPTLSGVRAQIAKDLQALRAVIEPDRNEILDKLGGAEAKIAQLKIAGAALTETNRSAAELPANGLARAWTVLKRAVSRLFTVRQLSGSSAELISADEHALRRQHLQLLLSAARQALSNEDTAAYRSALATAVRWLQQSFDENDAAVQALTQELNKLGEINIAPPLPSVSESARLLERFVAGNTP